MPRLAENLDAVGKRSRERRLRCYRVLIRALLPETGEFMKSTILTLVLVFCVLVTTPISAAPDIQWQHVYPYPTAAWLKAVTWGPSGFVATGGGYGSNEILFSADGKDWRRITPTGTKDAWFEAASYHDG